jgi:hypothetical protein
MLHFDSIETKLGERLDTLAPAILTRMRPYDERAGGVCESDRLRNLEPGFWNKPRAPGAEKSIECFARIANVSTFDQCARDVRTTNRAAAGFLHHGRNVDVDAKPPQSLDDILCADFACITEGGKLDLELVRPGDMQCKQVNLAWSVVRAEFHAGNDPNAKGISGKLRLLKSGERVVIGESDCRQSCGSRGIDDGRRRERAVRRGRVHVQIDLAGPPFGLPRGHHCL